MKYKKYINKESILFVLLASTFVSITLFEAIIVLMVFWEFYLFTKRQLRLTGILKLPIFMISIPAFLSTSIYGALKDILKVVEHMLFLFIYFLKDKFVVSHETFRKMNIIVIIFSIVNAFVISYNIFFRGKEEPIWGGVFEIGNMLSLGAASALIMTLIEKKMVPKFIYLSSLLWFVMLIFVSAKRSSLIGLFFVCFVIFVVFIRSRLLSKRTIICSIIVSIFIGLFGMYYAIKKFPKYKILIKIVTLDESLTEQDLNRFSSNRWLIGKRGLMVIKKDLKDKNIIALIIGHGYNSGQYLDPPSPVGRTYESIIFISEFIRYGIVGLFGMIFMMYVYFKFSLKIKILYKKDLIALPFIAYPAFFLTAAIFTNFWDAMLPVCLFFFGIAENYYKNLQK